MKTATRVAIVAAGYVLAFVLAWVVELAYVASTASPDRDVYGGMFAFGDALLFLFVLGVGSIPATGAALYFLRGFRPFWIALVGAAAASTLMGIAMILPWLARYPVEPGTWAQVWVGFAPLRALAAPVLALAALLAAILAPARSLRRALLVVVTGETLLFGAAVAFLAHP